MTFHSGGDCWEILRAVGVEERKSLVILRYFHPWPDLSAQYIPGICLYVRILCAKFHFFSQTYSIVLSVHVITHAPSLSCLLPFFLLPTSSVQLSLTSSTSKVSHISFSSLG